MLIIVVNNDPRKDLMEANVCYFVIFNNSHICLNNKIAQNKSALRCLFTTYQWFITLLWLSYVQKYLYTILDPYAEYLNEKVGAMTTTRSLSG